jgi:molecular chaperone DnaK (HSP70)
MPGTLAIDLGSTTTVVAWQDGTASPPRLLALAPYALDDPAVVPSLIWLTGPEGAAGALVGRQVLDAGLADGEGPGLLRDFKRRIGASPKPPSGGRSTGAPARAGGSQAEDTEGSEGPEGSEAAAQQPWLTPEAAGALFLRRLWRALPPGVEPDRLVLTAPIEAYRSYRLWLREVCGSFAVPELALVDEPTAAAIGAGLPPGSRVLVVDFGGGTLDLSLVQLEGGEGRASPIAQLLRFAGRDLEASGQALRCARVLGKAGLRLGGRDLDRWIAAELVPDTRPDGELLRTAEALKCQLSNVEEAVRLWSPAGLPARELRLSRRRFEALLEERGLHAQLDTLLEAVWAGARREGLARGAAIDAVLPVGGSSRIPLIRRWLQERCPGVPLRGERPVEAVALGALALTPGVRLRDVLSRGVSLRCWDRRSGSHRWHPLFVAGQGWPTTDPLEIVLACSLEGQEAIELVLGEPLGEARTEVVFRNGVPQLRRRPAGEAAVAPWRQAPAPLPLQPPGQAGQDRLRLCFSIDAEARLCLEGEDLVSQARLEPRCLGPVC